MKNTLPFPPFNGFRFTFTEKQKLHLCNRFLPRENVLLQAEPFVSAGSFPEFTTFNYGAEVSAPYLHKKLVSEMKIQKGKYSVESSGYSFYPPFVFTADDIRH